ncbi:MAG TPA: DUF4183 domain-containing protein [Clostridiales bacterium]|nr:DUF4183 domain-containing protein [Clostridiales bacterium]
MATTLFKLAITAETQTSVQTKPEVKKYFYELDPSDITAGTLTIPATSFVDEQGNAVTDITLVTPDNGYYLLFINGVLQQDSLYTVSANDVVIPNVADDIEEESPIILVVNNFAPTADSVTTVNT